MRQLFFPVLILIAMLVIGTVLMIMRPNSWWPQVAGTISAVIGRSAVGSSGPLPSPFSDGKAEKKNKGVALSGGNGSVTVEVVNVPPNGSTGAAQSAGASHPFPLASEIANGTAKSAILERFGPPQATVTGADRGQLRERLLYVEPATQKKTVIFLVNSNSVGAETGPQ